IAAGIAIEAGASLRAHAYVVAGLVQHRVHRGVEPRVQPLAPQARLALAPVGGRDRLLGGDQRELQAVAREQQCECQAVAGRESQYGGDGDAHGGAWSTARAYRLDRRRITMSARSCAMSWRRMSSSCPLASSSRSSKL